MVNLHHFCRSSPLLKFYNRSEAPANNTDQSKTSKLCASLVSIIISAMIRTDYRSILTYVLIMLFYAALSFASFAVITISVMSYGTCSDIGTCGKIGEIYFPAMAIFIGLPAGIISTIYMQHRKNRKGMILSLLSPIGLTIVQVFLAINRI